MLGVSALTVDGAGNVYIASANENGFKITPAGVITHIFDATGDGAGNVLDQPTGIAVDGSGNVYVAGFLSENVFQITPGGVITEIIDMTGDGAGHLLLGPAALAADSSGNVYVAGSLSNNAFEITPTGVITQIIDTAGDGAGNPLLDPEGIGVDGSGSVYVVGFCSSNAFRIELAECFLVIGDGSGRASFFNANHLFETQLDQVEDSYAVLMDDIPEFVVPGPWLRTVATGMTKGAAGGKTTAPADIPEWLWDAELTIQILLWNPSVFPNQPEQYSAGVTVRVLPDGQVTTREFGSGTGIQVWAETDVNAEGQPVVRFPFLVPGL